MLAAAGIGFLYLLTGMLIEGIQHGNPSNWWFLCIPIALCLWMVVLGSMLAKAELTEKK
jgi:hypothetical protein